MVSFAELPPFTESVSCNTWLSRVVVQWLSKLGLRREELENLVALTPRLCDWLGVGAECLGGIGLLASIMWCGS